jgi:hypothetical protein
MAQEREIAGSYAGNSQAQEEEHPAVMGVEREGQKPDRSHGGEQVEGPPRQQTPFCRTQL